MLTNAVLWKNGEISIPRYRDMRKVLKILVESRKQMGLAGRKAGA